MQQIEQEAKLAEYQRISTVPLLIVGIVFIASFVAVAVDGEAVANALFYATWGIFIIDYLIQLYLSEKKWRFITTHIPYLVALIIPVLRIWALFEVFRRLFWNKNSTIRDRLGLGAIFASILIVVFGALLALIFEAGAPGANILTYGEALWWAAVTLTTVGYGDYVPVTVGGRIVGVGVFSIGVMVLAVLTAAVVHWFTEDTARDKAAPVTDAVVTGAQDMLSSVTKVATSLTKTKNAEPDDDGPGRAGTADETQARPMLDPPGPVGERTIPAEATASAATSDPATTSSPSSKKDPDPGPDGQIPDTAPSATAGTGGPNPSSIVGPQVRPDVEPDPTQLQILAELQALNARLAALEHPELSATPLASPGMSDHGSTMKPDEQS